MSATRRVTALSAALIAVLGTTAPVALAGTAVAANAPMLTTSGSLARLAAPHTHVLHSTSSNWSGYVATGSTFTSVSASWTQPAASCGSSDTYSSFWVGLDGDGSDSVEQTGSEVDCSGGSPEYSSWYEMYPAYPVNFSNTVEPGDKFTASVTSNGSGSFTLKLADTTQGWSHTLTKKLSSAALASAEIIAEAPSDSSGPLPLTDFGTVKFTNATANGSPIGGFSPDRITMKDGSTTKATTSSLSGGGSFSVTWDHE